MPKVSIIIPCYNYGRFIKQALDSVWQQTFRDYEVIIVDDGSTDAYTIDVLRKIENDFPQVQVIRQENGGAAKARNAGIARSLGEFILPLDADDVIDPQMIEKCLSEIEKNDQYGFVYTDTKVFGDFTGTLIRPEYDFYRLLMRNYVVVSSMIRKKAWEDVGGYDENMHGGYEDWEMYIRMGSAGYEGKLLKEALFSYREHGISKNKEATEKHALNVGYIREKHPDLYAPDHLVLLKELWRQRNKGLYFKPGHYMRLLRMAFYIVRRYGWKQCVSRMRRSLI